MTTLNTTDSRTFAVLAGLLAYPESDLITAIDELDTLLPADVITRLQPVINHLSQDIDLIELQEQYVATFDRRAANSLHLFEHVHGESRDRGQAMVDLRLEYVKHGLEPSTNELPDYVPLFLEFLGQVEPDIAENLLGEAIHVLARLGSKLHEDGSPYACIFDQLLLMSDIEPEELPEPSEGELEEQMITFGPDASGLDPIMKPYTQQAHRIIRAPRNKKAVKGEANVL